MFRTYSFFGTLVGQKVVMAVSGVLLVLFLIGHLLGNMLVFAGPDALNAYAALLKRAAEPVWIARIVLLIGLITHIVASVVITVANWRARPIPYIKKKDIATNYAARTMIVSGPLLLIFIVYHLMMFTFLTTGPGYSHTDVYGNVVAAFRVPAIAIVYVVGMVVLGYHLDHAIWSMLHTVGISNIRYKRLRRFVAPVLAILIGGGYITIPLAIWIGVVR